MPNIIEQQDLLKGLPDARLAMLMQNPAGDIPPFLVAAEAQRRQAIRQQYAGGGSNESVVDTLTKQMANVPQNIQAPAQTPPQMPAPMQPQMQPQMPQQQGMADGGMVRRYAEGGDIEPMWSFPSYSNVIPRVADWVGDTSVDIYDWATTPYSEVEKNAGGGSGGILDIPAPPDIPIVAGRNPLPSAPPKKPRDESAGKRGTSAENKYKAQEAAMRDRLEALYADDEPSSWEDAQKWFAMSQQIMNPEVDLMQGLVNAGAAFADASAQQSRSERDAARAREEALLNWDMQIMQSDRDAAARAAEKASDREFELMKMRTPEASSAIRAIGDLIDGIDKQLENGMMLDEATKAELLKQREAYAIQLANIMRSGGFGASGVITRDQLPQ